ncbi:hypothetical protein [Cryobacterium sp. PAMC25264]|nr:hypothetical protein [Cryobacterium sp. PAMC25264]
MSITTIRSSRQTMCSLPGTTGSSARSRWNQTNVVGRYGSVPATGVPFS